MAVRSQDQGHGSGMGHRVHRKIVDLGPAHEKSVGNLPLEVLRQGKPRRTQFEKPRGRRYPISQFTPEFNKEQVDLAARADEFVDEIHDAPLSSPAFQRLQQDRDPYGDSLVGAHLRLTCYGRQTSGHLCQ